MMWQTVWAIFADSLLGGVAGRGGADVPSATPEMWIRVPRAITEPVSRVLARRMAGPGDMAAGRHDAQAGASGSASLVAPGPTPI